MLQLFKDMTARDCLNYTGELYKFKQKEKNRKYGKMAQLWIQLADRIWLVLMLICATKENNSDLHLASIKTYAFIVFQ